MLKKYGGPAPRYSWKSRAYTKRREDKIPLQRLALQRRPRRGRRLRRRGRPPTRQDIEDKSRYKAFYRLLQSYRQSLLLNAIKRVIGYKNVLSAFNRACFRIFFIFKDECLICVYWVEEVWEIPVRRDRMYAGLYSEALGTVCRVFCPGSKKL